MLTILSHLRVCHVVYWRHSKHAISCSSLSYLQHDPAFWLLYVDFTVYTKDLSRLRDVHRAGTAIHFHNYLLHAEPLSEPTSVKLYLWRCLSFRVKRTHRVSIRHACGVVQSDNSNYDVERTWRAPVKLLYRTSDCIVCWMSGRRGQCVAANRLLSIGRDNEHRSSALLLQPMQMLSMVGVMSRRTNKRVIYQQALYRACCAQLCSWGDRQRNVAAVSSSSSSSSRVTCSHCSPLDSTSSHVL